MLGIITIANGDKKYVDMAKMLALSLSKTNPEIKRAVITDRPENNFEGLFDFYIPYNPTFGKGLSQKLYLDKYSPFEETIFIDADCLAIKSLKNTIDLCKTRSFVVLGDKQWNSGEWYMDVASMCKQFNIASVSLFNGGIYYFKNNQLTQNIYDSARNMSTRYTELGFKNINGSINEEPLISVAMAIHGVESLNDMGTVMRTPIGIKGPLTVDVLLHYCKFNKEGVQVEPAILHFSGAYSLVFHYKRECIKLKLAYIFPFISKTVISAVVNLSFNSAYGAWVFLKRVVKVIIRGEKFDFKNYLPVFSNQ